MVLQIPVPPYRSAPCPGPASGRTRINCPVACFCLHPPAAGPACNPQGSRNLLQLCASVRKGHRPLLAARTKVYSFLWKAGWCSCCLEASTPILPSLWASRETRLEPLRAPGKAGRASPLSGLSRCSHGIPARRFPTPPPQTLGPRAFPSPLPPHCPWETRGRGRRIESSRGCRRL